MQEQLIQFETAKLAKEKGFNYETHNYYINNKLREGWDSDYFGDNTINNWNSLTNEPFKPFNKNPISAPTQSLLQKWLREKYKIVVEPTLLGGLVSETNLFDCSVFYVKNKTICESKLKVTRSYEEALEQGLIEALKLI